MNDELITLKCPKCQREQEMDRLSDDPINAVKLETLCPDCDGYDDPTYYDKNGKDITETHQPQ